MTSPATATLSPFRRLLNFVYAGSGALAGVFLVAIALLSLMQMGARQFGFEANSYDDFAGWAMAASSFLGLAYTLRRNEHIRVALLLDRLPPKTRRAFEWLALAISTGLAAYFAWFSLDMVLTSYQLNDMSQGLVAVPLWIPQSGMALGVLVLLLSLLDDWILLMSGHEPSYRVAEKSRTVSLTENV
ncbi:TRAP transporter small permease [Polaromonas sp.]|uniref:TRAP transporter small permease n=1 Tax=Polaromonas sp. TaxID=1869339 RepID=UPI00272FFD09|nr:TRAP transporter small permease subunit [Polaromonas sp.]MDP1888916.1 TRAP transporter small permease subunit [Polaromonas sp.]